jgi:photosystem II stability/assembly factor-like uncharacterized protein
MKFISALVAVLVVNFPPAVASGESIGSISHIHGVRIFNNQILLGTHEGLFRYLNAKTVSRVSPENFDVMGLSISGDRIFASGHPGPGSKLPEPVGLLLSVDSGKSWKKVGLQGKVDFHLLESAGDEIYGGDSQSGNLLYSKDSGKSWFDRGQNKFSDIAINPNKTGALLLLSQGRIYASANSAITTKALKNSEIFDHIEWNSERLIASSERRLLISRNSGKSWKMLQKFPAEISALTQSKNLIGVVVGSEIFTSRDGGKTFSKV